uniref:Rim9 protein n=1 Tax=Ganoderma boninense TaxID=34458 RepID=A0A5K1JUP7_9APHY|nr:Rim9 protein [Ganoderma boninense]
MYGEETLRLPPEIIGEIINVIYESDDRKTLLSCALVCQEWLHESRKFLFRDINISSKETFRSFVRNVLRSERLHPWLTSAHDLWIEFFDGVGEEDPEAFVMEISECLPNLCVMQLTRFPQGQKQTVHLPLRADLFRALGQFTSLHELCLNNCTFASFTELKSLLIALPALSSLSMASVSCPDSGDDGRRQLSPTCRPALSYLSVAENSPGDILYNWLSSTPTMSVLRELSLDFHDIVAGLQMAAGPSSSLVALTIRNMWVCDTDMAGHISPHTVVLVLVGLGCLWRPQGDPELARLSQVFSGTEDIALLRLHTSFFCRPLSWGKMARVLEPFAAMRAVRVLRFCCFPEDYHEVGGAAFFADLEALDGVLQDGAFSALAAVEFTALSVQNSEDLPGQHARWSALLEEKLPCVCKRGVAVELYVYK